MRILVIEDEAALLNDLCKGLKMKGYAVDKADNGRDGYRMAIDEEYDLIILDLNLPQMDGLELLSRLKKEKEQIKVLILSANHQLETKLSGFELGASDYLTKPFHFEELEARIRSLLNRRFIQQTTRLVCHELCMDTLKRTVTVKEQELHLTAKEFAILEYFLLHESCLITQQDLIDHVWDGDSDPFSNSIRVHLSALRKKIKGALGYDPIKTKIGEGYILS